MAHNSLSPAFIKLYYNIAGITHTQTIPVVPFGTPIIGNEPSVVPASGGSMSLSQFMTDYMVVFRPMFASITTVQSAEFWYMPTPTSDPIWIYDHPINLPGTQGATANLMGQAVLTLRTNAGGIFRWYGMELASGFALNVRVAGASLLAQSLALSNYLKGATSGFVGRDGGKLVVPIWYTTKINDALRKRRLLM